MPDNRGAQALRRVLKQKSQVELGHETEISQSHLSRLAQGDRVTKSRKDALALKRVAGIEVEWWDEPPLTDDAAPDTERAHP
jgi:transcriptional regulator with XRE-family HTH domain